MQGGSGGEGVPADDDDMALLTGRRKVVHKSFGEQGTE